MHKLFFILTLLFTIPSLALEVPTLTGPVVDKANVIKNPTALSNQIRELYQDGKGPQINILTISSLVGDNLESFANKVFSTWRRKKILRLGLFLLVFIFSLKKPVFQKHIFKKKWSI